MDKLTNVSSQTNFLYQRWTGTWASLGIESDLLPVFFRAIVAAYTDTSRRYHTLRHLCDIFMCLEQYRYQLENPLAVDLAVFYHDIIYSTYRHDNEERSAKHAQQNLQLLGCSTNLINLVAELINATKRHEPLQQTNNFYYFLDADLAILAAPPDIYKQYTKSIRQEYSLVPDLLYRQGRAKVLRAFLERSSIYYSNDMCKQFDAMARKNMLDELVMLQAE